MLKQFFEREKLHYHELPSETDEQLMQSIDKLLETFIGKPIDTLTHYQMRSEFENLFEINVANRNIVSYRIIHFNNYRFDFNSYMNVTFYSDCGEELYVSLSQGEQLDPRLAVNQKLKSGMFIIKYFNLSVFAGGKEIEIRINC